MITIEELKEVKQMWVVLTQYGDTHFYGRIDMAAGVLRRKDKLLVCSVSDWTEVWHDH